LEAKRGRTVRVEGSSLLSPFLLLQPLTRPSSLMRSTPSSIRLSPPPRKRQPRSRSLSTRLSLEPVKRWLFFVIVYLTKKIWSQEGSR